VLTKKSDTVVRKGEKDRELRYGRDAKEIRGKGRKGERNDDRTDGWKEWERNMAERREGYKCTKGNI
jgi:hypothetical protein